MGDVDVTMGTMLNLEAAKSQFQAKIIVKEFQVIYLSILNRHQFFKNLAPCILKCSMSAFYFKID